MRFSKKYFIANWKMNKTLAETKEFCQKIAPHVQGQNVKIALPFVNLQPTIVEFGSNPIEFGAQNVSEFVEGAYTGEVSAKMLKGIDCSICIVGHSERRKLFSETDASIAKKMEQLVHAEITPVLCVGETLEEKNSNETFDVLKRQLASALSLVKNTVKKLFIAYEPVWAIGSSKAADPKEASCVLKEVLEMVKNEIPDLKLHLLYGGSVSLDNLDNFLNAPYIDGVLVGGASLNFETFKNFLY